MSAGKKDKTIFREMLWPLLSVLLFEMLLMVGIVWVGGVFGRLEQNAEDMLAQQTENRGNYLLNEMIGNWANLELLSTEIDETVQERLDQGQLSLEELNENSPKCIELLNDLSPSLISTMYNKQISGIYLMFNTRNPDGISDTESVSGIYLRDLDPLAKPSKRNADLLWERAPVGVVQAGYIATDSGWQPVFSKADSAGQAFFYNPFWAAYKDDRNLTEKEYGYWTTQPYCLSGDSRTAISYSIPLILDDATVYGVLGVELLTDYVQSLLPGVELLEDKTGSYLLAVDSGNNKPLTPVIASGGSMDLEQAATLSFVLSEEGGSAADAGGSYYASAQRLALYSNHAPFDGDKWYLLGVSSKQNLFAFSRQIQAVFALALAFAFTIGLAGVLFASYRLSKPIKRLSEEVEKAQSSKRMPVLSATGIREIDQFTDSISGLGLEVVEASTRLISIMDMASVELAGYEIREESNSVYVTDNYFRMLGDGDMDVSHLTLEAFQDYQEKLRKTLEYKRTEDGSILYSVPQANGKIRYLRFEQQKTEGRQIGLIEDVTVSTLEKKRIEQERDSDGLTKLYARRGFRREADALFRKPAVLKHAALLMVDLDNLKTTNDRFGHDVGDKYIQAMGRCLVEGTPKTTICARMSGDEFMALFYGYDSREEVREKVELLYQTIRDADFVLPNGSHMGISASGGVAWYPEDSGQLSELMKYADFAMYQVKHSKKGEYREFDMELFKEQQLQNQNKMEFRQILENRAINYSFQPIFDSRTGAVFAYEALMRVDFPLLSSPETMLRLAKEEGCMHEIEYLTMFRSAECYEALLQRGLVSPDAYLFVNSIAGECMTMEEEKKYHEHFGHLQDRIVMEITEVEHMDMDVVRRKSHVEGFSGMFALDDYGSGYNSEMQIMELNPKFAMVDISIVRDVDKDENKQQIVKDIVRYGHSKGMKILVKGLETPGELRKVLEMDVDLLQGFYMAVPGEMPPRMNPDAMAVLQECQVQK